MRALGIHQACSPNLDIARDARWGRVQETYGEDPYLASAIGVAFVRGLQGEDRREGVLATAKHFLGYGMADGGRNIGAVQLGERDLLEVQARPFGAAIAEAGLESVMCAYSDVNGEPAAASRRLLTDMLRGVLGFEGMTVADYGAVNALYTRQQTATDAADAGVQALRPGSTSSSLARSATRPASPRPSATGCSTRRSSTRACGASSMRSSGSACSRARTATWRRSRRRTEEAERRSAQALARRIATRSTVLLANPKGVLPLRRDLARVAVIGPNARSIRNLFGGYSAPQQIEMMTSGDMGLPAPVQGGEVDDDVMAAVAPRGSRQAEGHRPGLRLRPAHRDPPVRGRAGGHRGGLRRHVPTVLAAIEATVSDGTEVVYALGCHVNDPSTDGIPEAVERGDGLRRRDPRPRRQDRPGERRGRRRDPRPHDARARRRAASAARGRVRDRGTGGRGPRRLPAGAGVRGGGRARRRDQRVPAGIGGRRGDRRRPVRPREPLRQDPDHDPADGRSVPDLPRVQARRRAEHLHRPRRQRTGVPLRPRPELHDLRVPVHRRRHRRGRRRGFGPGARRGGEHGRPRRRGGRAALRVDPPPRRHPSRAGARRLRPRLARSR